MKKIATTFILAVWMTCVAPVSPTAAPWSKAVRETAEWVFKKFGKGAAGETVEQIARSAARVAARHGDDALPILRKTGHAGFRALETAGRQVPDLIRLYAKKGDDALWLVTDAGKLKLFLRYGDDAAEALIRHPQIADRLVVQFGDNAAAALTRLSRANAQRLSIAAQNGLLTQTPKSVELLRVIRKYGDEAMSFIWKNKGALVTLAMLTTFIRDPEPYISGGKDLVVEAAAKPAAEIGKKVVEETAAPMMGILSKHPSVIVWVLVVFFLVRRVRARLRRSRNRKKRSQALWRAA